MNWTTEVPKESGWYWVKVEADYLSAEVLLSEDGRVMMAGWEGSFPASHICLWGNKLEIPE